MFLSENSLPTALQPRQRATLHPRWRPSCPRLASVLILFAAFSVCLLVPFASAQITGASGAQATSMPGVGHDYIKLLAETVNPSNGQVSIRIDVPTRGGRGGIPYAYLYNSAGVHHVIPSIFGPGRAAKAGRSPCARRRDFDESKLPVGR
jgi:hypothetical protein